MNKPRAEGIINLISRKSRTWDSNDQNDDTNICIKKDKGIGSVQNYYVNSKKAKATNTNVNATTAA